MEYPVPVNEIIFSRDQRRFQNTEARTPAGALLATIASPDDVVDFLSEVHIGLQRDKTYKLLGGMRDEIDQEYGQAERLGEAFHHGAAAELDIIAGFAPYLLDDLYEVVNEHLNTLSIQHFVHGRDKGPVTHDQHQYVDGIVGGRHSHDIILSPDEIALLSTINTAVYSNDQQYAALVEGFTFMQNYAHRANKKNYSKLRHLATTGFKHMSDNDFAQDLASLYEGER